MSEEFNGLSGQMKESQWLSSEDLAGDVKVTIEGVKKHRDVNFSEGRLKAFVYSLRFSGKSKELVLNATNRKSLVAKFGNNVKNWVGKDITLYVLDGIRVGKEIKQGIRIK